MGKELTADSYEITYPKNATKVGKYSILVTLKGDYYAGNITENFTIIPKGTAFTKLSLAKRRSKPARQRDIRFNTLLIVNLEKM